MKSDKTDLKEKIKEILMKYIPMIDLNFEVDEDEVDKVVKLIMNAIRK